MLIVCFIELTLSQMTNLTTLRKKLFENNLRKGENVSYSFPTMFSIFSRLSFDFQSNLFFATCNYVQVRYVKSFGLVNV